MKRISVCFFFFYLVLFSCTTAASGSGESNKNIKHAPPAPEQNTDTRISNPGGYVQIDIKDKEALSAYNVVKQHILNNNTSLNLKEILNAEKQIVAGFKIRLDIRFMDNQKEGKFNAVVYFPLTGDPAVLSIDYIDK